MWDRMQNLWVMALALATLLFSIGRANLFVNVFSWRYVDWTGLSSQPFDASTSILAYTLLGVGWPIVFVVLWLVAAHTGPRVLKIEPDGLMDFRNLPFPDNQFKLVAFDPPHLVRAGPKSWLGAKYGKLGPTWQADITQGFAECFRVLAPDGTLVFKWNETQVKLREVLALTPEKPLFGQISGRKGLTHWLVFMKDA